MTADTSSPVPLTSIDVLGVGLSIEMFDQSQVWSELQQHDRAIIPNDPMVFPNTARERNAASDKRAMSALKSAIGAFVEHWPIPSIAVWPHCKNPELVKGLPGASDEYPYYSDRINDLRILAGLHRHKIESLGAFFHDTPEEVLERSFKFFDGYPDVPALLMMVSDGDQVRSMLGDVTRKPYCGDGPRRYGSMTESFVALLLARRDRVESLRAVRRAGAVGFKPSKYLREPWTEQQFQQFDSLPTIARLYRPIRIAYRKDRDGKPTFDPANESQKLRSTERQEAFKVGFDAALKNTRDGNPARVIFDIGGSSNGRNSIPLSHAINSSLPEFDALDPGESYDIGLRIGDTGAASPLVQWALACFAAFDKKDESITVSLRQTEEATITLVTSVIDERKPNRSMATDGNLIHIIAEPALTRSIAIGARMNSGDECPQEGMWKCDPPDADAGAIHFFAAGRTFPKVTVMRPLTGFQKMRGLPAAESVPAGWTLVSYEVPVI